MIQRFFILMMLALASLVAHGSEVTTVQLRSTVRLRGNAPYTLSAIAQIEGPQRGALGGIAVPNPVKDGAWTRITAEEIRELIEHTASAQIGSIVVRGTELFVTRRTGLGTAPTQPLAQQTNEPAPTLHDSVVKWLAKRFGVSPAEIRITLRDADTEALGGSSSDRMVEIAQIGNSRTKLALRITVYHGERVERSFTVQAKTEIKRRVLVLDRDITRSTLLDKSMFTEETRWFTPFVTPASPSKAVGLASRTGLRAGSVVMINDLESPIVISRGDIVSARSIAGNVVVNLRARALKDARDGELFELESLDKKSRFTARASGPGRAVIVKEESIRER